MKKLIVCAIVIWTIMLTWCNNGKTSTNLGAENNQNLEQNKYNSNDCTEDIESYEDWKIDWNVVVCEDWKVEEVWTYQNWKKEWLWTYYNENWWVEEYGNYKNDQKDWYRKAYYENWILEEEGNYIEWEEDWEWIVYHTNWLRNQKHINRIS